jgi:DNA helicase II / ATP-dependent DNA helicase PcrA
LHFGGPFASFRAVKKFRVTKSTDTRTGDLFGQAIAPAPEQSIAAAPTPPVRPRPPYQRPEYPKIDFARVLNPEQYAACTHKDGPLLILAGAGSGKTRTIVHRIAWLVTEANVRPWEILAVTFTNKAAREMRERVQHLLKDPGIDRSLWVGTFHAVAARVLRRYADRLGYPSSFTIYDDRDQAAIIKDTLKDLGIGSTRLSPEAAAARLDQSKNEAITPDAFRPQPFDFADADFAKFYPAYQKRLRTAGAMDFGDLIVNFWQLLVKHEDVAAALRQKFRYLLVDEFQDTNRAQYLVLRELSHPAHNLCVVGDDDQSIYSWRGAVVGNILAYPKDFDGTEVIKLVRNYRSTQHILSAAGGVIAHNTDRYGKTLITDQGPGEKVKVWCEDHERDEAGRIVRDIRDRRNAGRPLGEFAIFYRTNSLSRVFEEQLAREGLPYIIVGATRFYDRKEIKDTVCYLRLLVNPLSDVDFLRVVNEPPRGIGDRTIERLSELAAARSESLSQTLAALADGSLLPPADLAPRAVAALVRFHNIITKLREAAEQRPLVELLKELLDQSGYWESLSRDTTDEARGRLENLEELITAAQRFCEDREEYLYRPAMLPAAAQPDADAPLDAEAFSLVQSKAAPAPDGAEVPPQPLREFLELAALAGDQEARESGEAVSLMTVHAAKGLEFDHVYVAGLEENLFPHQRSVGSDLALQEERRLFYVAMTRARKTLVISHAQARAVFGMTMRQQASRFLDEIPEPHVAREYPSNVVSFEGGWGSDWRKPTGDGDSYGGSSGYARGGGTPARTGGGSSNVRSLSDARRGAPAKGYGGAPKASAPTPPKDFIDPDRVIDVDVDNPWGVGRKVKHAQFGTGEVRGREGAGPTAKIKAYFPGVGLKTIIQKFLEPV